MLNKRKCHNCDEKVKSSHNFCPSCGIQIKEPSEDWGMLGKKDTGKIETAIPKMFGGGLSGNIMNKMLGNAMKMLEKEMQKEMKGQGKIPKTKVKLMINGKEMIPHVQHIQQDKNNVKILPIEFSGNNLKKWSERDKEEPKTNLKRMGDTIQYEMEIPEVLSIKDISIIKLEKSLEVKAIAKEKAYLKIISIDLPLKKFTLLQGKLTLELDASI